MWRFPVPLFVKRAGEETAWPGDAVHRVRFTAALPGRYEDFVLLRRPLEKILLARLMRR